MAHTKMIAHQSTAPAFVLAMLAIVIMSIPFAAAERGRDRNDLRVSVQADVDIDAEANTPAADGDTESETAVEVAAGSERDQSGSDSERDGDARADDDRDGEKSRWQSGIRAGIDRDRAKLRAEARDIKRAKEKYQEQQEKYAELRAEFQGEREKFLAIKAKLRDQLKACRGDTSEECKEIRHELAVQGQPFLLSSGHVMLAILEKVKIRIEAADELSEEEADAMMDEANGKIAAVKAAVDLVEKLDEDSPQEEVAEAAAQLQAAWKNAKPVAKVHVNRVSNSRLGGVIVQMGRLNARMENVLARMEAKGTMVADLEAKLVLYHEALVQASAHHQNAVELQHSGKATEELKAAKLELKNARSILQELVHGIKLKANEKSENKSGQENRTDGSDSGGDDSSEASESDSDASENDAGENDEDAADRENSEQDDDDTGNGDEEEGRPAEDQQ